MRKFIVTAAAALTMLALPSAASAATGSLTVQNNDDQVTVNTSITTTTADFRYGPPYDLTRWYAYAKQAAGAYPCEQLVGDSIIMVSTELDGPSTYSTPVTFTPTNSPQTRICLYVNTRGFGELVAEVVIDTQAPATQGRIGAICKDGWHSTATGSGACSSHGGVSYRLYSTGEPIVRYTPPTPAEPAPIYAPELPPRETRFAPATTDTPTQPVVNRVKCNGKLVAKPRSCVKGNVKLTNLRWLSWGSTAKATGTVKRAGRKSYQATIKLSRPSSSVYTKLTIKR